MQVSIRPYAGLLGWQKLPVQHSQPVISNHDAVTLRFAGEKKKGSGFYTRLFLFLSAFSGLNYLDYTTRHPDSKPGPPSQNIEWSSNVSVLASSSQRHVSFSLAPPTRQGFYGSYLGALGRELSQKQVHSLEEAHQNLMEYGYSSGIPQQFPTATPRTLGSWDKRDNTPQRYVLMLADNDPMFEKDIRAGKKTLQDLYNLSDEHFRTYTTATPGDVAQGIGWLKRQIENHPQQPVEIIILYSGHGDTRWPFPGLSRSPEGDLTGELGIGLSEPTLKNWVNKELKGAKVHIILDCCHAGAWIANNNTPNKLDKPA